MQTTTPRRSLWSVFRAYRQIGRLRSRTVTTIALLSLVSPVLTLLTSIVWVISDQLSVRPLTTAARASIFVLVCFGALCTEMFHVVVGWLRFRKTRPLVKLFDTEPVLQPMAALQRDLFGIDEEELPLMAFAVSGSAATLKKMRSLLRLSPEEVGRALRLPTRDIVALERGTKSTSDPEWGIVLREVLRLGEEKEARIGGAGGGLTNVDPFSEHAIEVPPSPPPKTPCAVCAGMVNAGHAPEKVAREHDERERYKAEEGPGVGGRPLTHDEIAMRGWS
jgi:hypothetical protein